MRKLKERIEALERKLGTGAPKLSLCAVRKEGSQFVAELDGERHVFQDKEELDRFLEKHGINFCLILEDDVPDFDPGKQAPE
ncbi:MAG: hypothetical protein HPY68_04650 [Candidatus Atribacteria bacterium]|nr:hypothetical protein [Candidatus Atribacteria bacterium]